jgi:D-beta-D-heptose 7-phosphate kinase/D-beta-D-heptose 1-phosphate adenosyltransferase
MSFENLVSSRKVLVIGDIILDHYIYGNVYRISPEAPVPVVLKQSSNFCLGGAANVAQNVTSLGADCYLIGVTGEDRNSVIVEDLLKQKGISSFLIKDKDRPTTEKIRVIGNNHQIARIDSEIVDPVSSDIEDRIIHNFKNIVPSVHGIIVQDYGKGMLNLNLLRTLFSIAKELGVPVLVDPKDKDFSKYSDVNWIKPNLIEFKSSLDIKSHQLLSKIDVDKLIPEMISKYNFGGVLVTLSENGMVARTNRDTAMVDGYKVEVTDVSGAGDTVSAVFLLCQICNITLQNCLEISNMAGAMVCQISGAVSINSVELFQKARTNGWLN